MKDLARAVGGGIPVCPQPSCEVDGSPDRDPFQVGHVPARPCDDIVPCSFRDGGSFSCLVKIIGGQGEIRHSRFADDVGPDVAHTSLKFDSVDVFHMNFV